MASTLIARLNTVVWGIILVANLIIHNCRGCTPVETSRVVQIAYNYDDKPVKQAGLQLSYGPKLRPGTSASHQSNYSAQDYKSLFAAEFGKSGATIFDWTHVSLWLFEKQQEKSLVWQCHAFRICSVHQVVGTCGSVEFRMPWVVRKQKFIPDYRRTAIARSEGIPKTCGNGQFSCESGECIPKSYECDSDEDCTDGSDENQGVCAQRWLSQPRGVCRKDTFQCDMGTCIPLHFVCDKSPHCPDGSDEDSVRCRKTTFPHLLEAAFWMKGSWISPDRVVEPLMQAGGLDIGNITSYVCRFISAQGGIIPGRLLFDSGHKEFNCRYAKNGFEEISTRNESYQVLLNSPKSVSYMWERYKKGLGQRRVISVLGEDYELYYVCHFEFEFDQDRWHKGSHKVIVNGFFKPTAELCVSPFGSFTRNSSEFYLLTERGFSP